MTQKTVLVIDDSATIRRLVDSTLSPVGYNVVLADGAETGIAKAVEAHPDMIILDHQLPGTTGVEVCSRLLSDESLRDIPVIASSTMRKKAYMEYADCPNVVDMLPKPYTAELLVTTVANALDTASMVVDSQRDGTAVPEVMDALGDAAMTGVFQHFSLRSVLDFLNNARQDGVLEIEAESYRVWIHVARGRVQTVTANGVDADELINHLPESLQDLGPVLRLTVGGGSCAQIEGLVQLLDNKVLDPRLLQKLLRHQASMLLLKCFTSRLMTFRFETERRAPALHERLSLDVSVVALLVEACLDADNDVLPEYSEQLVFSRKAIRGQNLDRAGLSAHHQKVLSLMNEGVSLDGLAAAAKWDLDEARRVLYALTLADLVDAKTVQVGRRVVVLETDARATLKLREASESPQCPFAIKVVRDRLSLQLIMKRQNPDIVVIALDSEVGQQVAQELAGQEAHCVRLGIVAADASVELNDGFDGIVTRPFATHELFEAIEQAWTQRRDADCAAV